ncbi:MAG: multicopper oxidase domain-containing protein, partial [Chloroflexota bacterium]
GRRTFHLEEGKMEAGMKPSHPGGNEAETTEVATDASAAPLAPESDQGSAGAPEHLAPSSLLVSSRRGFLRGALVAAGGAVAATVATTGGAWSYAPIRALAKVDPEPLGVGTSVTAAAETTETSSEPIPEGWSEHDIAAREKVRRFVGNLAGPLGLAPFIGEPTDDPEFTKVAHGNQPLEPRIEGDAKVFDLTVDEMDWQIDAQMDPVKALGYNSMWPGPAIRVTEGDLVRINVTNNLDETTSVHPHGLEPEDFRQDGIPFITQPPIIPGETFTYEFVARPIGSHMYHSHHNATEQVGRGLLGAFIVDPADPNERYDTKYGVTQEYIFIHNDMLGGFTINGHGFPATVPIVAKKGERVLIRYMNEGIWMHPWHTHGFRQRVVARDGAPLGSAEFYADTLGVNPGERFDTIVECDRVGVWAFHCHILTHVEAGNGMFGMVTALVVTE